MEKIKAVVFALAAGVLLSLHADVSQGMSPEAASNFWRQVDAVYAQKEGWSKAERKIDSQILSGIHSIARPKLATLSSKASATDSPTACETVDCNIRCKVSDRLLGILRDNQATVISVSRTFGAIHAAVPVTAMAGIAEDPDVISIRKVLPLEHNGSTVSEGVIAHRVNLAKADYGATGKGMTVGVISDGCDDLASLQASGDLPSDVRVLSGREGAGYEGGAMMEIVHDLAPSAKLFFACAGTTCEEFAEAVLELRQSGCDVIVDDVYLHDDPAFEEGAIAQAINAVTADGAVYVTCACNFGRTSIGNARVWNGDFKATEVKKSGQVVAATFNNGQIHAFYANAPTGYYSVPMQAVNTFEDVDTGSDYVYATLQWSDKWGASTNDYDLYVVNLCNGKIIASSVNVQDGNGDPFEVLAVRSSDLTMRPLSYMPVILVVKKTSAQIRFFRLCVKNARLGYATEGWISGHHGCENAITCAAAPVPEGARAFTTSDGLEDFSADGPCYRFFKANGEPYTDGGFTKSGVKAINKPDIAAADQVSCSATGFESFSGTSAAAPHAAAIAALMLEVNPTLSPSGLKQLMLKSALTASSGWNRNSGYGIVDALKCVQAAKKAPVKTYTMTWNANGGTVSPATSTFAHGTKTSEVLKSAPTPKRAGWNFGGWYRDEAFTDPLDDPESQQATVAADATFYAKWVDDAAAVSFALPEEMTNGVAIENAVVDTTGCTSRPTVKVTGLPTGLKFTTKLVTTKKTTGSGKNKVTTVVTNALPNTIYGTPTKSGVYTVVATVTTAGKKTASCSQSVVVRKAGENVVKAEVALIDAIGTIASTEAVPGKVTGMGVYAKGKKVTLKATANKGYVFAGWFPVDAIVSIASTCLSRLASYTIAAMPTNDVELTAMFITSGLDKSNIVATVNGMAFGERRDEGVASTGASLPRVIETNVWTGVYLEWPVAASALSATTVKVTGLPSGLKFDAKTNRIYGAPTSASKTKKVKITVTTAGKSSQTFEIDMAVDPLPSWAVGTFTGPSTSAGDGASTNGTATVTIGANGKISAKQPVDGKATRFVANYFDSCDDSDDCGPVFHATLTAKVGKEVVTNEMVVGGHAGRVTLPVDAGETSSVVSVTNGCIVADRFDAWQYNWKSEPWKSIVKVLDKETLTYYVMSDGACVDGAASTVLGADGVVGKVTLKFAASGAVTVSGEFAQLDDNGQPVYKKSKLQTVKATGSTTLVPMWTRLSQSRQDEGESSSDAIGTIASTCVFVYLAPKGLQPHARCVEASWAQHTETWEYGDVEHWYVCFKPVIYLYPETNTTCSVQLALNGELTCTYPAYGADGWRDFVASPDGTLTFPNGSRYYCLYWEGVTDAEWDFSRGFCVKGSETASFLADILLEMGLTFREANEFIVYWLPLMQDNPYNVISFQGANYANAAKLSVDPKPDSVLRVFMAWRPSDRFVDISAPVIVPFVRQGFTVVEWGGTKVGD